HREWRLIGDISEAGIARVPALARHQCVRPIYSLIGKRFRSHLWVETSTWGKGSIAMSLDEDSRGRTERLLLGSKDAVALRHRLVLIEIEATHRAQHKS